MKLLALLFAAAALVLLLALTACGPRTEALTADAVARAVNGATPALVAAYELEGAAAIDAAPSRLAAEAALGRLRTTWRPVWEAHEALRRAHDAWLAGLTAGEGTGSQPVLRAYCVLRSVAAPHLDLPDSPVGCP